MEEHVAWRTWFPKHHHSSFYACYHVYVTRNLQSLLAQIRTYLFIFIQSLDMNHSGEILFYLISELQCALMSGVDKDVVVVRVQLSTSVHTGHFLVVS